MSEQFIRDEENLLILVSCQVKNVGIFWRFFHYTSSKIISVAMAMQRIFSSSNEKIAQKLLATFSLT